MAGRKNSRSLYLRAFEHEGYWTVKIGLDAYDSEGTPDEVLTVRESTRIPDIESSIDQAWVVLCTALHVLEKHGSTGRIGGLDWPALDL